MTAIVTVMMWIDGAAGIIVPALVFGAYGYAALRG